MRSVIGLAVVEDCFASLYKEVYPVAMLVNASILSVVMIKAVENYVIFRPGVFSRC